uniref:Uncharacterized protein n=1 Tax=Arundo donax TaxID=35708 RepID=A0A0A9HKW4_ARUDO
MSQPTPNRTNKLEIKPSGKQRISRTKQNRLDRWGTARMTQIAMNRRR